MIVFLINSHPYLDYKRCNDIAKEFLVKRLYHFFPDALILENADSNNLTENDIIFELSTAHPFIDVDLIKKAIKTVKLNTEIRTNGFIPGTTFTKCYFMKKNINKIKIIHSKLNKKYNTQFNLLKLKRQKIFKFIITKQQNIYKRNIKEILKFLSSKKGLKLILQYGEDVKLIKHKSCPYCKSKNTKKLFLTNGHAVTGFITNKVSYYSQCEECSLVFLKYTFPTNKIHLIYDSYENEREINIKSLNKINSSNTSHYENYMIAFKFIRKLKKQISLLDLGCGGCEFLSLAKKESKIKYLQGVDFGITHKNKEYLKKNSIQFKEEDFINNFQSTKKYDVITLWEVIEHIEPDKLDNFIQSVLNLLHDDGYLILSTPDFDAHYSKLFDFWAAFPIHHLSVLSKVWLYSFFEKNNAKIAKEYHESVCLKPSNSWFNYYQNIDSKNIHLNILSNIHLKLNKQIRTLARNEQEGSEIILIIQKKEV